MTAERNTKQKQAIYEALCELGHPSATELYEYIHGGHPAISRGTVFRVLSGFAETGRAQKLHFSDSDDRFDATLSPHAHARCRCCGNIFDVFLKNAPQPAGDIGRLFEIERCDVEFYGICSDCKK